jgi:folate-binding protein YgfZ
MESVHLSDRAVIALEGPEARGFLQGLITNDLTDLTPGHGLYAALLAPQGKILFDFLIAEGDGAVLLDCQAASAEALVRKLKLYRLRAKIEIALRPQLSVYAGLTGRPAERAITFADPRLGQLGPRSIGALAEMPADLPGPALYHAARLGLGVPEGSDFGSDKIFALDAGLDELHAIAFAKGCYIGQELTARMKHRGTARKRILTLSADAALPANGDVMAGDNAVGEIVAAYGAKAFALVRLDRLETNSGELQVAQIPVALTKPAWLD